MFWHRGFWKVLGYLLYVMVYIFVTDTWNKNPPQTINTALFKILPIYHLIFIVYTSEVRNLKNRQFGWNVILGLIFSSFGDICLVWRVSLFIPGLLFFAIGHVFYIRALGFKPFGSGPTVVSMAIIAGFTYYILLPGINNTTMQGLVLMYLTLIYTMAWRTLVQYQIHKTQWALCAFVGACLFIVSDFMIAWDKWRFPIANSSLKIMLTYYGAQLAIALAGATYSPSNYHDPDELYERYN